MACEKPKDCLECPGCKSASDERERQLDKVHGLIEIEIKYTLEKSTRTPDDPDYADWMAAGITNALDGTGWLNLENK